MTDEASLRAGRLIAEETEPYKTKHLEVSFKLVP